MRASSQLDFTIAVIKEVAMLTATYSIVAISAEQKNTRKLLAKLQLSIRNIWKNFHEIDFAGVEAAIHKLAQFDQIFHSRKMEKYVIPAIKNATHAVDGLLDELEALSEFCVQILQSFPNQVRQALDQGIAKQKELRRAMELYCSNLQLRLVKEEQELLPLVHQVLNGDEIFELGAQFLSDDGKKYEGQQVDIEME
jgi:hemerythrin-like domain-containing protein